MSVITSQHRVTDVKTKNLVLMCVNKMIKYVAQLKTEHEGICRCRNTGSLIFELGNGLKWGVDFTHTGERPSDDTH